MGWLPLSGHQGSANSSALKASSASDGARATSSGPNRNWVKVKCPGWKRINAERYRLFGSAQARADGSWEQILAKRRNGKQPAG